MDVRFTFLKRISSVTFLYFFLLGSCYQDNEHFELPPITQTGENTFGCKINGRVMVPRDGTGTFNMEDRGLVLYGSPEYSNYLDIIAHDFASDKTSKVVIRIENLHQTGICQVNESNCTWVDSPLTTNIFCRVYDYDEKVYKSYCSYPNSGEIIITRFDDNKFIAGEFHCRLRQYEDPSDEIEITSGRFDIDLSTLRGARFP